MQHEITDIINRIMAEADPPVTIRQAARLAVETTPPGYGLSTEYAFRRYRALCRGQLLEANPLKQQLWHELAERVRERRRLHPDEDDFRAIDHIISYEAPSRWFVTPMALTSEAETPAFLRQFWAQASCVRQMSMASCSTQPGCG